MATVREKGKQTWRETCLQLQRRREGGGGREGFPDSALSPLRSSGAPGLGSASKPPPPLYWGGAPLVYGEGYSSSALVIASLILLLHPCGMPA